MPAERAHFANVSPEPASFARHALASTSSRIFLPLIRSSWTESLQWTPQSVTPASLIGHGVTYVRLDDVVLLVEYSARG